MFPRLSKPVVPVFPNLPLIGHRFNDFLPSAHLLPPRALVVMEEEGGLLLERRLGGHERLDGLARGLGDQPPDGFLQTFAFRQISANNLLNHPWVGHLLLFEWKLLSRGCRWATVGIPSTIAVGNYVVKAGKFWD